MKLMAKMVVAGLGCVMGTAVASAASPKVQVSILVDVSSSNAPLASENYAQTVSGFMRRYLEPIKLTGGSIV